MMNRSKNRIFTKRIIVLHRINHLFYQFFLIADHYQSVCSVHRQIFRRTERINFYFLTAISFFLGYEISTMLPFYRLNKLVFPFFSYAEISHHIHGSMRTMKTNYYMIHLIGKPMGCCRRITAQITQDVIH